MLKETVGFRALGTDINIQLVFQEESLVGSARKDLSEMKGFFQAQEKIFSRFDPGSELSLLNNDLGKKRLCSHDIIRMAEKCLDFYKESDGIFDPRIISILEGIGYHCDFRRGDFASSRTRNADFFGNPLEHDLEVTKDSVVFHERMDFSGIAKGHITDQAAGFLRKKGWHDILVDSGGDIRVLGNDLQGESWKIAIEGIDEEKLVLELGGDYCGVATSGISRRKWENEQGRFHHLIDPRNPCFFDFSLRSVTVLGKSAEESDFWAKVLFILGRDDGLKKSKEEGIKSIFIDSRGDAFLSEKIRSSKRYKN